VRIALERGELGQHPLQVGLSMQVKVDTHDQSGDRMPHLAQSRVSAGT
jgi:membrane fusion protein (multidrug efflux system)